MEGWHLGQRFDIEGRGGGKAVATDEGRRLKEGQVVDGAGLDERGGEGGAGLDEEAGQAQAA